MSKRVEKFCLIFSVFLIFSEIKCNEVTDLCGLTPIPEKLVAGGTRIQKGQFPW